MYSRVGISHTFVIPIENNNHLMIERIKSSLESDGGFWQNGDCGDFMVRDKMGKIQGVFQVESNHLHVTILQKPVIASYSFVENLFNKIVTSLL